MRTGYVRPGTTADPRSAGPRPSSPIYVPRHNSLSMSPTVVKPTNLPLSPKPNARVSIRHSHMGAGGIVPPHKVRYKTAPVSPKANGAAVSPQRRSFAPALDVKALGIPQYRNGATLDRDRHVATSPMDPQKDKASPFQTTTVPHAAYRSGYSPRKRMGKPTATDAATNRSQSLPLTGPRNVSTRAPRGSPPTSPRKQCTARPLSPRKSAAAATGHFMSPSKVQDPFPQYDSFKTQRSSSHLCVMQHRKSAPLLKAPPGQPGHANRIQRESTFTSARHAGTIASPKKKECELHAHPQIVADVTPVDKVRP